MRLFPPIKGPGSKHIINFLDLDLEGVSFCVPVFNETYNYQLLIV